MVDDEVAAVIERELALLTPEVRGSADQLEELLDPDFGEIGKSGRLWTRDEMIAPWSPTPILNSTPSTSAT